MVLSWWAIRTQAGWDYCEKSFRRWGQVMDLLGRRRDILKKLSQTNLQNVPVMEQSFLYCCCPYLLICLKLFLPFYLQHMRPFHLFLIGVSAWVRASSCCTSFTHWTVLQWKYCWLQPGCFVLHVLHPAVHVCNICFITAKCNFSLPLVLLSCLLAVYHYNWRIYSSNESWLEIWADNNTVLCWRNELAYQKLNCYLDHSVLPKLLFSAGVCAFFNISVFYIIEPCTFNLSFYLSLYIMELRALWTSSLTFTNSSP